MKKFLAGVTLSAAAMLSFAQTGLQYPDEMISAAIAGDEAKVLEIKARADLADKPQRGDRKSARALNTKALADISSGNFDVAIEALTKAAEADPLDAEIPSNLGYAYIKNGAYDQAKKALARSISLQSGRGSAWATLAEAFARSGDIEKATACFNIAYTFSQNRDKTKEFFSKIIAENADASLVAAAKAAMEYEGVKPIKKGEPTLSLQQAQPQAESLQPNPVAATSPSSQEPVAQEQVSKEATPENLQSRTVAPVEEKTKGQPSVGERHVISIVIAALIIILTAGGYYFYRRKGKTSANGDHAESGGLFRKKYAVGVLALVVSASGAFVYLKDSGVTKERLVGSWNCSNGKETFVISFPSKADEEKKKQGGVFHVTKNLHGLINREFMPFVFSVREDKIVEMDVSGRGLQRWSSQENQWKVLLADEIKRDLFAEVSVLNKDGMVITLVDGSNNSQEYILTDRPCNRIDLEKNPKLLAGVEGSSGERPGLPKFEAKMKSISKQESPSVVAELAAKVKNSDFQAYMELLALAERKGRPICDSLAAMAKQHVAQIAPQIMENSPAATVMAQQLSAVVDQDLHMLRTQCFME